MIRALAILAGVWFLSAAAVIAAAIIGQRRRERTCKKRLQVDRHLWMAANYRNN